jgi:tetratricopeptide (TPR) repeat protein
MPGPDRWRRVEEVFHQALERPESERSSWLQSVCGDDAALRSEVLSLLESDRAAAGAFVGAKVERAVIQFRDATRPTMEGRRLGPYRLIRELGRGGMGAVYLAERSDEQYESEVAIQVVRPGLDTDFILKRFRRERQILASLQHPNIARLLDGGTAEDGTPYLVMEFIRGAWITKYAAAKRLAVEERLRMFLPVCAAVEHAHQHFVVHRDLKPGNILIDQTGIPKLLDFGVSKLLHANSGDATEPFGMAMMTPEYASPEQIVGDPVTVASDVYSLGAVLYELLSGARPHRIDQCTPFALERAICIEAVVPPSAAAQEDRALARRLTGDLDAVVLRAMEKQPERRYQSVEQMAADIRRHLEHRPVTARPGSFAYRADKFVRRNRLAVGLGTLVAASLIGGTMAAVHEARIANARFNDVRKLATTFVFDVEQAARDLPGSMKLRQLITRTGLEYLRDLSRSAGSDWALKRELATAYIRIGELQGSVEMSNLGDTAGALESFRSAQALLDAVLAHSPVDRKAALDRMTLAHRIANLHRQTGERPRSLEASEDGLRRAQALLASAPDDAEVIQYASVFHLDLARMRQQSGDLERAAQESASGIRLLEQLSSARPGELETLSNIASSHSRLGDIQAELGRRDEALASFRAGLAMREEITSRFPNNAHARQQLMLAYSHLGDILGNPAFDNFGDAAGARAEYRKMLEIARTLNETDPEDTRAIADHGIALLRFGTVSPAVEKWSVLEWSIELLERAAARSPKDMPTRRHKAWAEVELANTLRAVGDRSRAMLYYRAAIDSSQAALAADAADIAALRWTVTASRGLAEEQVRAADRMGAESTVKHALQLADRAAAQAPAAAVSLHAVVARAWQAAGAVHALLAEQQRAEAREKELEAARDWYERSMAEWRRLEPLPGFTGTRKKEMAATAAEQGALAGRARVSP